MSTFKDLVNSCKSFEGLNTTVLGSKVGVSQSHLSGILSGIQTSQKAEEKLIDFIVKSKVDEFELVTGREAPEYYREGLREYAGELLSDLRDSR